MTIRPDGSGWHNSLSQNGCSLTWLVDRNASNLFGTSTCGDVSAPPQFQPVVFWFFTYMPTPKSSATICSPAISLWDATVTLDLGSGNVTNVHKLKQFDSSMSLFSSLSGNLTGSPLRGRAYNGINFTLSNPDKFVIGESADGVKYFAIGLTSWVSANECDATDVASGGVRSSDAKFAGARRVFFRRPFCKLVK